jgi:hypothetical protein
MPQRTVRLGIDSFVLQHADHAELQQSVARKSEALRLIEQSE